ncbi:unnamed protein product, partial [Prorocentrum cordatum]
MDSKFILLGPVVDDARDRPWLRDAAATATLTAAITEVVCEVKNGVFGCLGHPRKQHGHGQDEETRQLRRNTLGEGPAPGKVSVKQAVRLRDWGWGGAVPPRCCSW